MKQFTHTNVLIEVSLRELELIMQGLLTAGNRWMELANNTLKDDIYDVTYNARKSIAEDYYKLYEEAKEIWQNIPF